MLNWSFRWPLALHKYKPLFSDSIYSSQLSFCNAFDGGSICQALNNNECFSEVVF